MASHKQTLSHVDLSRMEQSSEWSSAKATTVDRVSSVYSGSKAMSRVSEKVFKNLKSCQQNMLVQRLP